MHSSKVELKTSLKHTMILTTKPPQNIINKEKINFKFIMFGMKLFKKFQF
jgi:hypothetical protein